MFYICSSALLIKGRVLETILNASEAWRPAAAVRTRCPGRQGKPPPGITTRCEEFANRSGANAGEEKRGAGAQNRHGESAGRRASRVMVRKAPPQGACLPPRAGTGVRAPVRLPALRHPFIGVSEATRQKPGRENAPRERKRRCEKGKGNAFE